MSEGSRSGTVVGPTRVPETIDYREFWLDQFASRLGFGWLARRLPGSPPPSYVYAVIAVLVPTVGAAVYNVSRDIELVYTNNPYLLLQPVLLIGAVYAARVLHRDYDRAMVEMDIQSRSETPERLRDISPGWLPWVLFGVAVAVLFLVPGDVSEWTRATTYVFNFVVLPFVYTPIVVQFFTVYLSIEFLAPWRLANSDVGIHFYDPEGVGGLRPIGELIKKGYYFVMIGLIGYAFITFVPFVESNGQISAEADVLFTGIWIVTIATVAFAVFTLHRFMHRAKRAEINRLEAEIQALVDNPWDVKNREVPAGKEETVADLQDRITQVSNTREYPATFTIWTQLLVSFLLPKAVQLAIIGL